jgi:peroxiredoxin
MAVVPAASPGNRSSPAGAVTVMRTERIVRITVLRFIALRIAPAVAGVVLALAHDGWAEVPAADPDPAELVRGVRDGQNAIHLFDALHIRVQMTARTTPRWREHFKATTGKEAPAEVNGSGELAFDATRFRSRSNGDDEVLRLDVWDGQSRKEFWKKNQDAGIPYRLGTFSHGFLDLRCLYWLQVGSRQFWWSQLPGKIPRAQRPNDYVLVGQEEFHGEPCYRIDEAAENRRLYIGLKDKRLVGIVTLFAPAAGEQAAERSNEAYFRDYREAAPGFWVPGKMEADRFRRSKDETFLAIHGETTLVELDVNPTLSDDLFDIDIPTGAAVVDSRLGPGLEYKSQPEFSDAEWAAICAPWAKELEEARRDRVLRAVRVGQTAPDFPRGEWIGGSPMPLADLRGKVVILEFVDQECGACTNDVPALVELHRQRDELGIVVIAIHTAGASREAVERYVEQTGMEYPLLIDELDRKDGSGRLDDWFGVRSWPSSVVIDRQGDVAAGGRLSEVLFKARQLAKVRP